MIVAVEADPNLCNLIKQKFKEEIKNDKLIVENCVVITDNKTKEVPFYISKEKSVWNQYPKPFSDNEKIVSNDFEVKIGASVMDKNNYFDVFYKPLMKNFKEVYLPSKDILEIIKTHGNPYYIKIDVERYDHEILKRLLTNNIIPPYISAESNNIEVFSSLIIHGRYNAFKLVEGATVPEKYKHFSFPEHSAGPFGNDINGPWMTAHNFFHVLGIMGLGWKDIHASNVDPADPLCRPTPSIEIKMDL